MAVANVSNIATLRTLSGSTSPAVLVEGYVNAGDGGGGDFWYNASDTSSSDNGATIIVSSNGRRFYRIWDGGRFNVLWAGADRTGVATSDAAFDAAKAVASYLYLPKGVYQLAGSIVYYTPSGFNSFTIEGDGPEASIIYFLSNSGIAVGYPNAGVSVSSAIIKDISITAGKTNSGVGIAFDFSSNNQINNGISEIINVRLRGND